MLTEKCSELDLNLIPQLPFSGHFIGFLFFAVCGSLHAAVTLSASLYYGLNRTWYHYYGDGTEPKVSTSGTVSVAK